MSVAIVVPVYNAQATIESSILSAREAGDFEIICVDDGSQDASASRIEALIPSVPNLSLVRHPTNQGVGAARNTGLRHVTRRWVTFLDSDDLISAHLDIKELLKPLEMFSPDLMFCLHKLEGSFDSPFDYGLAIGRLNRQDLLCLASAYLNDPRGNSIVTHCWGKVYRTEFLRARNLQFREDLPIYEDIDFVASCMAHAKHAYFSDEVIYTHTLSRGLSRAFTMTPLGFRHALSKFAGMLDGQTSISRANAVFLAKTLSISRQLTLPERANLCSFLAKNADQLEVDVSIIKEWILRAIVGHRLYRYACASSIALTLFS